MLFRNNINKEVKYDSLEELFNTDRGGRMSLFGTYLAKSKDKSLNLFDLKDRIDKQIKTHERYINNLQTLKKVVEDELKEEARKKIADRKPEEVAADVEYMTADQLAALKAAIEAKENQQ